jgi:hypothetical protein
MRPVRTARANFVWTGPDETIGDLHSHVEPGAAGIPQIETVWEPSPEERAAIAAGANISLRIMGMQPPVIVGVTEEQGVGEDDPKYRERLREWRREISA